MICVTTSVALYFHLAALLRTEIKVKLATCAFVDEIDTAFKFNNQNYGYKGWDSYKATFPYNTFFFFYNQIYLYFHQIWADVYLFDWTSCVLDHLGPHPHTEIFVTHQVYTPTHRDLSLCMKTRCPDRMFPLVFVVIVLFMLKKNRLVFHCYQRLLNHSTLCGNTLMADESI